MNNTVTIDRELLERIDESAICDGIDATISNDLFTQLVSALAAPRQPEGDGLEVVATLRVEFDNEEEGIAIETVETHVLCDEGETELCRLSDAQRAIAELRDRLDVMTQCADNYSRMFGEIAEECEHLKACQENAMLHMTGLVAERDTLRQQLAERDAQIASMRAEVTPFIETHWMPVARQRDKLAGLLRRSAPHVKASAGASHMMEGFKPRRNKLDELSDEIDTALAEVEKDR